ncbi:MAG TPA: MerR family transcriptional regulator [Lachnospiraceae bacterium]|nr:MerR family transcriptional regulator [Lachnospiraceae bacterium]
MEKLQYKGKENSGDLKVCKRCKKTFTYYGIGYQYCPTCKEKDEEDFQKVKEYIRDHGIATVNEVVEETGVDEKRIHEYLREGRLEIPEGSSYYLKCERCGKDITSGRFCASCAMSMKKEFTSAISFNEIGDIPKTNLNGKMRFLDNKK